MSVSLNNDHVFSHPWLSSPQTVYTVLYLSISDSTHSHMFIHCPQRRPCKVPPARHEWLPFTWTFARQWASCRGVHSLWHVDWSSLGWDHHPSDDRTIHSYSCAKVATHKHTYAFWHPAKQALPCLAYEILNQPLKHSLSTHHPPLFTTSL